MTTTSAGGSMASNALATESCRRAPPATRRTLGAETLQERGRIETCRRGSATTIFDDTRM